MVSKGKKITDKTLQICLEDSESPNNIMNRRVST